MTTVLTIVLAVLIVFNIWLAFWTAKLERERRRKYQERLEECDEQLGDAINEMVAAYEKHLAECGKKKSAEDMGAEPDTPLKAKPTTRSKKRAKK